MNTHSAMRPIHHAKSWPARAKLACLAAGLALAWPVSLRAANIVKAYNTNALNMAVSWTNGVTPGSGDVAVWDSNVTASLTNALGASTTWAGLRISNPGGAIIISNQDSSVLTLGASGIDMSAATQKLTLGKSNAVSTAQTWKVVSGKVLQLSGTGANAVLTGSGALTLDGGGTVVLNEGSGSTMADASSFSTFTGGLILTNNTTAEALRDGASAFGTAPVTLAGGILADGGGPNVSGDTGNWTWTNAMILQTGTSSTIDNQNPGASTGRYLLLQGAFAGSGNLSFSNNPTYAAAFNNANLGFIIAAHNTMSGTLTIAATTASTPTPVRVGALTSATTPGTDGAGTYGDLGQASVVNNGILTFSHTDNISVTNPIAGAGRLRIGGGVSGATGTVTLYGTNTYTGPTEVDQSTLLIGAGGSISNTVSITLSNATTLDVSALGGAFTLNSGQLLNVGGTAGNSVTVAGSWTANAGSVIIPGGSNTVGTVSCTGNLTLAGGKLLIDISNSGNDEITVGGTLNASGVTTLQFVPPVGGLNGGTYTLITAATAFTATPANFSISGLVSSGTRQSFTLVTNANTLELVVAGSPGTLTWVGDGVLNKWDVDTTTNWNNGGSLDYFFVGDNVTFDDTGSASPSINLATNVQPASLTVNAVQNYTFGGTGQIIGNTGLTKENTGTLTLNASNSFTGPVDVTGGTLTIAAAAALGAGPATLVTNQLTLDSGTLHTTATLALANTNSGINFGPNGGGGTFQVDGGATLTISNLITDSATSALTKTGNGTLVLTALNRYKGGTTVNGGTLVLGSATPIGLSGSWSPGFTLEQGTVDINGQGNYANSADDISSNFLFSGVFITFAGNPGATMQLADSAPGHAGFGVNGTASVNDVITYVGANNPGKATISAPWYAVGTGAYQRTYVVEVDPTTATNAGLEFKGQMSYLGYEGQFANIQKSGAGTLEISSTNYFPGLEVAEGTLLVDNNYALGADRTPNYSGLGGGATNVVLVDGGTIDLNGFTPAIGALSDNGSGSGLILNNGAVPATLTVGHSASNLVINATYASVIADGSNTVSLARTGQGVQTLTGINTYSGSTTVGSGTLLVNSPGQIGQGGASGTVTVTGGILGGSGIINAPVAISSGGTLAPGAGAGGTVSLTITTNLTLGGTNWMQVDKDTATNDAVILTAGTVNYGGTLVVSTNLITSSTLAFGDSFTLYSAPAHTGNFAAISGSPGAGLVWSFNPASGTLSVVASVATYPTNITYSSSGGTLTLSWPADHLGWRLLVQTNNLAQGISANPGDWGTVSGSAATNQVSLPINSVLPAEFYQLVYP